jgi:sterol desaturase/sphingolipid hydroxylase (fatty acid hydroxylase superfamily)
MAAQGSEDTDPGLALFRVVFVPFLLVLTWLGWVCRAELEQGVRGVVPMDFPSVMLLVSLLLLALAEQSYPRNRAWNYRLLETGWSGWGRLGRDVLYLFIVAQASAWGLRGAKWALTQAIETLGWQRLQSVWPQGWAFSVRVLLAFLAVELGSYWLHRAAHRFEWLWRFHSTHHVIEELTGLKAVRTHPVDNILFYFARYTPLVLVGAGAEELLAATYLGSILGALSHSNIDVSDRLWGFVVNFPRYHALHHSAELSESRSNFGCHTILWDRVFGTFRSSDRSPVRLGVGPAGPRTLWQELAWPFYRSIS